MTTKVNNHRIIPIVKKNNNNKSMEKGGNSSLLKYATSCINHVGGNVMASTCIPVCVTRLLVFFIYHATADRSSRIDFEVYRVMFSAQT